MAVSDPIADLLTRMRNAKLAKHRYVDVANNKMSQGILKILHEQGFIQQFLVNEEKRIIRVFMKYGPMREPLMQKLKRVSRPSLRRYVGHQEIPRVLGGLGLSILSTPKGVIDGETARKLKVGGELLCCIW
jgi:small subunit ribosomal protein S8